MADESKTLTKYPYLKNLLGIKLDEESLKAVPYAQAEVYTHATLKACQISSVAGAFAGTVYKTFTYRNFRAHTVWLGCLTGARYGMLLGVPVGIGATLYRMRNAEQQNDGDFDLAKAYYDRAYKLRKNEGQLIMDRLALAGSVVGLASVSHKLYSLANAASAGFAAGSLLAACRSLLVNGSSQEKQD